MTDADYAAMFLQSLGIAAALVVVLVVVTLAVVWWFTR